MARKAIRTTKPTVWKPNGKRPSFARVYTGNGNSLELVSLHVSVQIDGPRARTVVDHIFRNPHDRTLEGTFEYPLPSGASPSYYAMFLGGTRETPPPRFARRGDTPPLPEIALAALPPEQLVLSVSPADWGPLRQGRVFPKQRAADVYEEVVRRSIDPALLEYAGGNKLFQQVERNRPFEPHSYRDLARALEECGKPGLAALQYEILLAGTWHDRFGADLKRVAREEYARLMQEAIRNKTVHKQLADHFGQRLEMADCMCEAAPTTSAQSPRAVAGRVAVRCTNHSRSESRFSVSNAST